MSVIVKNSGGKAEQIIKPENFGCTKMAIDTYTPNSNNYLGNSIPHSLSEIPKVIIIFTKNLENANDSNMLCVLFISMQEQKNWTEFICPYGTKKLVWMTPLTQAFLMKMKRKLSLNMH